MKSFFKIINCCSKDKPDNDPSQLHATIMVNEDVSSNMIGSTSKSSGNTKTNKAKRKDNRKCLTDNIINYDIVRQIDLGNRSNHTTISLLTKLEEQNKQNQTDPNLNSNKLKKKQTVDEGIINIDEGIDENLAEFNHCPDIKFGSYNLCRNRNSQGDNIKLYSSSNNNKYDRISNFDAVKAKGTPLYTQRSNDSEISTKPKEFSLGNVIILDSEIKNGRRIIIQDEIGYLLNGDKLLIDAAGLKNSLRDKRDGMTYFGTSKGVIKGETINDYVLNAQGNNTSNKITNEISFVLTYDRTAQKYFIRNLNKTISKDNSLIFIKLENKAPYWIKTRKFFMLGHVLISVEVEDSNKNINITVMDKSNRMSKHYTFLCQDSPITIGRLNSTIVIDHSFISKIHCTIEYDREQRHWIIFDGDKEKKSSPGIWLMLDSKYEINSSTFVRIGKCMIKLSLI